MGGVNLIQLLWQQELVGIILIDTRLKEQPKQLAVQVLVLHT